MKFPSRHYYALAKKKKAWLINKPPSQPKASRHHWQELLSLLHLPDITPDQLILVLSLGHQDATLCHVQLTLNLSKRVEEGKDLKTR